MGLGLLLFHFDRECSFLPVGCRILIVARCEDLNLDLVGALLETFLYSNISGKISDRDLLIAGNLGGQVNALSLCSVFKNFEPIQRFARGSLSFLKG